MSLPVRTTEFYRSYRLLYTGAISKIFQCTDTRNHKKVVIKAYFNSALTNNKQRLYVQRELEILGTLTVHPHPNIIHIIGQFTDFLGVYIIQEYAEIGDLCTIICKYPNLRIPERYAIDMIIYQVTCGIDFIHSLGIIHRDIKPENILVFGNTYKICDFGLAISSKTALPVSPVGTLPYMAPELMKLEPFKFKDVQPLMTTQVGRYNELIDIWSLGSMIYEILCGKNLFDNKDDDIVIANICEKKIEIPKEVNLTGHALLLIRYTLERNVAKRMSAKQLLHKFWSHKPSKEALSYHEKYNNIEKNLQKQLSHSFHTNQNEDSFCCYTDTTLDTQ
jgi:serine/threonine protein kinase